MAVLLSFVLVSVAGCRTNSVEPGGDALPPTDGQETGASTNDSLPPGETAAGQVAPADDAAAADDIAAPGTLRVEAPTSAVTTATTAASTTEATVEASAPATTTSTAATTATTEPTTTAAVSTALSTTTTTTAAPSTTVATVATSATTGVSASAHPDIVKIISVTGRNPGGDGWKDSYSVGQKCYCATTFDHNIGPIEVDTPAGKKTVREVCEKIGDGPGPQGRPIYNDIQCGNGPANNAGDEDDCPGRVDIGREGCGHIGPKWDLTVFQ